MGDFLRVWASWIDGLRGFRGFGSVKGLGFVVRWSPGISWVRQREAWLQILCSLEWTPPDLALNPKP